MYEVLVDELQPAKTRHYLENIAHATARPGVIELMDEIINIKAGLQYFIEIYLIWMVVAVLLIAI